MALLSSETSRINPTTHSHVPDVVNPEEHRCENLKSRIIRDNCRKLVMIFLWKVT